MTLIYNIEPFCNHIWNALFQMYDFIGKIALVFGIW